MKALTLILSISFFVSTNLFAQTDTGSVTGVVKEVKPHFANSQTLVVGTTELVLISDPKDPTGNTFEINSKYSDILTRKGNLFVLNPKYKGKTFKFTYTTNGKGWKCISTATEIIQKKSAIVTMPSNK